MCLCVCVWGGGGGGGLWINEFVFKNKLGTKASKVIYVLHFVYEQFSNYKEEIPDGCFIHLRIE